MNLRTLRYFVTLAREQHFARAADLCGITQPTLSSAIAALEEELGKRLIERDRRFVGLTAEGRAMLPWAQRLLDTQEAMIHSVEAVGGPLRGEFRLGAIPAAMPAIGLISQALLATHEGLSIAIRSMTSREIVRSLNAYELDAGLTYLDHEPPAGMLEVPLYSEHYMLVSHAEADEDDGPLDWAAAARLPLCLLHPGMQNRRILDAILAGQGIEVTPRATADSYVALLALVRSGQFATIMPDSYVAMLAGLSWASVRPLGQPVAASRIGLIVADRTPLNPVASAAMAAARAVAIDRAPV